METRIIRDKRRKRSLAFTIAANTLTIHVPVRLSENRLNSHVEEIKMRIEKENQQRIRSLRQRMEKLNREYFQGRLKVKSISFSKRQKLRFGSCSPKENTIRLSHQLLTAPTFVLNYVIVHELAHLLEANHSSKFWDLVYRYPHTERARGYLLAVTRYNGGSDNP